MNILFKNFVELRKEIYVFQFYNIILILGSLQVLTALDALDRHSFDRMDANNSLDTLYAKIFSPPGTKEPTNGTGVNATANNGNTSTNAVNGNSTDQPRDNRADYVSMLNVCN